MVLLVSTVIVEWKIISASPLPVTFATMLYIIRYVWVVEMKVKSVLYVNYHRLQLIGK